MGVSSEKSNFTFRNFKGPGDWEFRAGENPYQTHRKGKLEKIY